ncbi:hypothetical protein FRC12_014639 [Ceratobasidium sp. 428]|nr:hypothetical protein FRC12_014639 [Ceratobasidium sp. 428]
MILDTGNRSAKSPTNSEQEFQTQSPASITQSQPPHQPYDHVSYATFPRSNPPGRYAHTASDITSLLGSHPEHISNDDDQPPAYDEIGPIRSNRNQSWTRFAAIALTIFLVCSTWASYKISREAKPLPNLPEPSHDPPGTPPLPPPPFPTSSRSTLPPHSSSHPPTQPSLPPLPPYEPLPAPPNLPYVPPNTGRTDLCREWAHSPNSGAHPSYSDKRPTDHLVYTIPSLAPIHIETSTICSGSGAPYERCSASNSLDDAFSGKLQVVGGDIDLPKVEIFLQHDSELGLEDLSVCLMQRPLASGELLTEGTNYKWVLGIYLWKDLRLQVGNSLLASALITVTLPYGRVHDFTTRLGYLSQIIGSTKIVASRPVSFGTLQLNSSHGQILVGNIEASTIHGASNDGLISFTDSRVGGSLDLRSLYGIVSCNVTLVQTEDGSPARVNLQSEAGIVDAVVDLDYSELSATTPQFDMTAYSRFSRATLWVTDQRGTDTLRASHLPPVLPTLKMNLTSQYAIAQAMVPATYHGSIDLRSHYAQIGTIDHADHLPGRAVEWSNRKGRATRGNVRWDGAERDGEGYIYVSTEFATVRLLFLGLDDGLLANWPKDSDGMEFVHDDVTSALIW